MPLRSFGTCFRSFLVRNKPKHPHVDISCRTRTATILHNPIIVTLIFRVVSFNTLVWPSHAANTHFLTGYEHIGVSAPFLWKKLGIISARPVFLKLNIAGKIIFVFIRLATDTETN